MCDTTLFVPNLRDRALEIQNGLVVALESGKSVVAAVLDDLRGACIVGHRITLIEHLVAGLRQ